jgi:hypothetical protein
MKMMMMIFILPSSSSRDAFLYPLLVSDCGCVWMHIQLMLTSSIIFVISLCEDHEEMRKEYLQKKKEP